MVWAACPGAAVVYLSSFGQSAHCLISMYLALLVCTRMCMCTSYPCNDYCVFYTHVTQIDVAAADRIHTWVQTCIQVLYVNVNTGSKSRVAYSRCDCVLPGWGLLLRDLDAVLGRAQHVQGDAAQFILLSGVNVAKLPFTLVLHDRSSPLLRFQNLSLCVKHTFRRRA